jgi:hypothetical protein
MTYVEAIEFQEVSYLKGEFYTIHQEHDKLNTWYILPSTKRESWDQMNRNYDEYEEVKENDCE